MLFLDLLLFQGASDMYNVTEWGTTTMTFQKWESHTLVFSRPQSAVIFHNFANTYLTVQVTETDGSLQTLRAAGFGTTFYGFDYGTSTGQISVAANKLTYVTYSTIAFPLACNGSNRYISTRSEESFNSDYEPNDENTHSMCIWYLTDGTYEITVAYDTTNGFLVCEDSVYNCTSLVGRGVYTKRLFEGSFYYFDRRHGTFNMSITRKSKLKTKMLEAKTLIDPILQYSFISVRIQNDKLWMGAVLAGCLGIGALIIVIDITVRHRVCHRVCSRAKSLHALEPGEETNP